MSVTLTAGRSSVRGSIIATLVERGAPVVCVFGPKVTA
jgi:hypothetical protein